MAEYVFAVKNCRTKQGAAHYASFSGTWGASATAFIVGELKKLGRLKDAKASLATVVANAAAAGSEVSATTDTYQERVGKAVMQIGMGYDASDADAAKDGIVWLNLE